MKSDLKSYLNNQSIYECSSQTVKWVISTLHEITTTVWQRNTSNTPQPLTVFVYVYVCVCVFMSAAMHASDTVLQSLCVQAAAPAWLTGSHWTEPLDLTATRTSPAELQTDPTASDWRCDAAHLRQVQRYAEVRQVDREWWTVNFPVWSTEQQTNNCDGKYLIYSQDKKPVNINLKERSQLQSPRCISLTNSQSQSWEAGCHTSPVEVFSGVPARQREGQRNGAEQLDDMSDVVWTQGVKINTETFSKLHYQAQPTVKSCIVLNVALW